MPRLLRDIVEDIVRSQADMEIVGRDWTGNVAEALEQRHADVLILRDKATDQVTDERLAIVAYAERDWGVFAFRRLSIAELSPQALIQAIRETQAAST